MQIRAAAEATSGRPVTPPADAANVSSGAVDTVLHGLLNVGRLLRRGGGSMPLDPGTFWILKAIATTGPLRISEVATQVNLDPSTVSRHVSQLQRTGLVERTPDPDDGRAQRVAVSAEGRRRLDESFARRRDVLAESLTDWPPSDIAEFERLLSKFARSLESTTKPFEETSL